MPACAAAAALPAIVIGWAPVDAPATRTPSDDGEPLAPFRSPEPPPPRG
jgi:hypothetical protein